MKCLRGVIIIFELELFPKKELNVFVDVLRRRAPLFLGGRFVQ